MKIAVIGSGNIGSALGRKWAGKGHAVMFGSRFPHSDKIRDLIESTDGNVRAGTPKEATDFGEVVALAIPGTELQRVLEQIGDLHNKILINCVNLPGGASASAEVTRIANNARVVRAFNTVPWEVVANPQYGQIGASIFINGDDIDAKGAVARLSRDIGFDPIDAGDSNAIPHVEAALRDLWRILVPIFGRDFGVRILRRNLAGVSSSSSAV